VLKPPADIAATDYAHALLSEIDIQPVAGQPHHGEGVLGGGIGVTTRRMRPADVVCFEPGRVEVVNANGGAADEPDRRAFEQALVDPGHGPDKEYISVREIGLANLPAFKKQNFTVLTEGPGKQGYVFIGDNFHFKNNSNHSRRPILGARAGSLDSVYSKPRAGKETPKPKLAFAGCGSYSS
jgi:hypothetical protein